MPNPVAPVVEPIQPQIAPQVAPNPVQEPPPAAPDAAQAPAGLPEALINVPAFQALVAGAPAAVSMRLKGNEDREEIALVTENQQALTEAGMGFYRSLSGEVGVMFNSLKIHPQDLQAADRQGKLLTLAPDFDKVNHETAKMGKDHPAVAAGNPTEAYAVPQSAGAPQAAGGTLPLVPPAPASVARKLAAQRIMNLQAGAPTTGASPGAGRLLNSIMKPVV